VGSNSNIRTNDPTKVPAFPKVPASASPEMRRYLETLEQVTNIRLGRRGDPRDRAVTLRELIDSGLAQELRSNPFDPNRSGNVGFVQPGGRLPDLAVPPAPTGFQANGAYSQINLGWDYPAYSNHSHTEVHSHTSDSIGDATLLGIQSGRIFVDPVGSGATRYYWVRHVNTDSIAGPFNAAAGTAASTAPDVNHLLGVLTGAITDSQLSQSLSSDITGVATAAAAAASDAAEAIAAKTAALLAQSNAETAKDNAEIAETNADTSRASASTSAGQSAASATSAAGSAATASAQAVLATTAKNNAGASAGAAATSASNASSFADDSEASATASEVSRVAADTAKAGAVASAAASSQSESNASASETASGNSAAASESAKTAAESAKAAASAFSVSAASSATSASGSATAAASTVNGLTARLNNTGGTGVTVEQAYSANASDIGDLEGQYTVKIDANGAVAGFGLANTTTSLGVNESEFIVNADRFALMRGATSSATATVPFVVQASATTLNGESVPAGVYMADAFIKNGSIANAKIGALNADKITAGSIAAARIAANTIDASKLRLDNSTIASQNINGIPTVIIKDLGVGNAKIQNLAVSTLKIQDQAVTFPNAITTSANIAIASSSNNTTFSTIQTLTGTYSGAPVLISGSFAVRSHNDQALMRFRLRRGSTVLFTSQSKAVRPTPDLFIIPFNFLDTNTSSGSRTYTLQAYVQDEYGNYADRTISTLEVKK